MTHLTERAFWQQQPVIPAVRQSAAIEAACATAASALFLLAARLLGLEAAVQQIHDGQKKALVHVDLVSGLAGDEAAVEYLADRARPDGLITTRAQLVRAAKNHGLVAVHRVFVMDSQALESALQNTERAQPQVIEVLPGVVPSVIRRFRASFPHMPLIAGGLVRTEDEVRAALEAGADAVSSSAMSLWPKS